MYTTSLFHLLSILLLLLLLITTASSAALAHQHGHGHRHNHNHDYHEQRRIQAQQHIQRAHTRHREYERSRISKPPAPTTQLYVAGYIITTSKLVIIPVAESREVREATKKMGDGYVGDGEGVLLFREVNDSKLKEIESSDLEKENENKKDIIVEVENWRVKREDKMEVKYWVMVWLMPALLLGVALQE